MKASSRSMRMMLLQISVVVFLYLMVFIHGGKEIGIDIGTNKIRVAAGKYGVGFAVVSTLTSNRYLVNYMLYSNGIRYFDQIALNAFKKDPGSVFQGYRIWLERPIEDIIKDPEVFVTELALKILPRKMSVMSTKKQDDSTAENKHSAETKLIDVIGYKVTYAPHIIGQVVFRDPDTQLLRLVASSDAEKCIIQLEYVETSAESPCQTLSFDIIELGQGYAEYIKKMVYEYSAINPESAVVVLSTTFPVQNRAYISKSMLAAGIVVSEYIDDHDAVAVSYFTKQKDLTNDSLFVFVHAGESNLDLSVYKLNKGKNVSGQDPGLVARRVSYKSSKLVSGGRFIRDLYNLKVAKHAAVQKFTNKDQALAFGLLENALSILIISNEYSTPQGVGSIPSGILITKEDLQHIFDALNVKDVLFKLLDELLLHAKAIKNEVKKIHCFGGTTRSLVFRKLLEDYLEVALTQEIDQEESTVKGAAFRAALNSKFFRVKSINHIVMNVPTYHLVATDTKETQTLWLGKESYGIPEKNRKELLFVELPESFLAAPHKLKVIRKVSGISSELYEIKYEELLSVIRKAREELDSQKTGGISFFRTQSMKIEVELGFEYITSEFPIPILANATFRNGDMVVSRFFKTIERQPSRINELDGMYVPDEKSYARVITKEKELLATHAAKNSLESKIYKAAAMVTDEPELLAKYSTEEEKAKLAEIVETTEAWFIDKGQDIMVNEAQSYKEKEEKLRKYMEGITNRKDQEEIVPGLVLKFQEIAITAIRVFTEENTKNMYVTKITTELFKNAVEATIKQLQTLKEDYLQQSKNKDHILTKDYIDNAKNELNQLMVKLKNQVDPDVHYLLYEDLAKKFQDGFPEIPKNKEEFIIRVEKERMSKNIDSLEEKLVTMNRNIEKERKEKIAYFNSLAAQFKGHPIADMFSEISNFESLMLFQGPRKKLQEYTKIEREVINLKKKYKKKYLQVSSINKETSE